ncbi:hypothetical protein AVEN_169986-1 [Araneus ventricosus]|uniref:Uncharacterized protein n=1 Tax=Araneus ventricosus TaxID=182803 RepID=A0A4Y2KN61_ARAVE|nr:hypothetical protein AVEN_169986-1 [Araneus ventricosus]
MKIERMGYRMKTKQKSINCRCWVSTICVSSRRRQDSSKTREDETENKYERRLYECKICTEIERYIIKAVADFRTGVGGVPASRFGSKLCDKHHRLTNVEFYDIAALFIAVCTNYFFSPYLCKISS